MPENRELAKKINDLFETTSRARQKYEHRWYLIDNFYEGKHFLKPLRTTGELTRVVFPRGIYPRPIPRAKKMIDSIVNLVLFNKPRWSVYPIGITPEERKNEELLNRRYEIAKQLNNFFQDAWEYLKIKNKARELCALAAKYNVGYVEVGVDENGNLFIDTYDPYDIYHEVGIRDLKETSFLIKVVKKTLSHVKNAKDWEGKYIYDPEQTKFLKPDYRYSLSEYKHIRMTEKFTTVPEIKDEDLSYVLLKECWLREKDHWRLVTECQGRILRDEIVDYMDLPFVVFKWQEGPIYQTSIFEDLIPLNKALDILVALGESYTRTMTVGKYLKHKMDKVERITNEHGEFVEYEGARPPEQMPLQSIPGSYFALLNTIMQLMEERGAAVISFGKVPRGVKAWRAIETLRSAEITNLQSTIYLFEKALEEIAEKILDIGYHTFLEPFTMYHFEVGSVTPYTVVSEKVAYSYPGSIPISTKYKVKVEIESGLAYTEEGKREILKELYMLKIIPPELVLESFKLGPVQEILEKAEEYFQRQLGRQASIFDTSEYKMLPPELKQQIIDFLKGQISS